MFNSYRSFQKVHYVMSNYEKDLEARCELYEAEINSLYFDIDQKSKEIEALQKRMNKGSEMFSHLAKTCAQLLSSHHELMSSTHDDVVPYLEMSTSVCESINLCAMNRGMDPANNDEEQKCYREIMEVWYKWLNMKGS